MGANWGIGGYSLLKTNNITRYIGIYYFPELHRPFPPKFKILFVPMNKYKSANNSRGLYGYWRQVKLQMTNVTILRRGGGRL